MSFSFRLMGAFSSFSMNLMPFDVICGAIATISSSARVRFSIEDIRVPPPSIISVLMFIFWRCFISAHKSTFSFPQMIIFAFFWIAAMRFSGAFFETATIVFVWNILASLGILHLLSITIFTGSFPVLWVVRRGLSFRIVFMPIITASLFARSS